jgi:hypothetical protein
LFLSAKIAFWHFLNAEIAFCPAGKICILARLSAKFAHLVSAIFARLKGAKFARDSY